MSMRALEKRLAEALSGSWPLYRETAPSWWIRPDAVLP
jgi:hypothetical protein